MAQRLDPRDRATFSAALVSCVPHLQRVARRLASSGADADDLVQETFLQALERSSQFFYGSAAQLRSWATTILRHLHCDRYRKQRREVLTDQFESQVDERSSDPVHPWRMVNDEAVEAAVLRLPKHMSDVYLLFLKGLSHAAIASRLKISSGTVGTRIHRARAHLRKSLTARNAHPQPATAAPEPAAPCTRRNEAVVFIAVAHQPPQDRV